MSSLHGLHGILPLEPASSIPPTAVADSRLAMAAASSTIRVLLAEADPDMARTLAGHLLADGYEPIVARSSSHACALAEMRPPRLAILGELETAYAAIDLLEQVRGQGSFAGSQSALRPDLPVIVLCAAAQELDLLRAFEAGADDFLERPPRYLELRGFLSSTAGTAISSRGLGKMAHFGCRDTRQFRARLASKSRAKSR